MVNKHIAKAIVDMVIFLEFASEDVVNADAAVEAIEQLAAELQNAANPVKTELVQAFRGLSPEYGERAAFVADLGEMLGLE
jgi:hypothetical protein